jgi:hypothetical protein
MPSLVAVLHTVLFFLGLGTRIVLVIGACFLLADAAEWMTRGSWLRVRAGLAVARGWVRRQAHR